jgi:hypothetical protein
VGKGICVSAVGGPAGILLRLFQLSRLTFDISPHSTGLFGFDIMAVVFSMIDMTEKSKIDEFIMENQSVSLFSMASATC